MIAQLQLCTLADNIYVKPNWITPHVDENLVDTNCKRGVESTWEYNGNTKFMAKQKIN